MATAATSLLGLALPVTGELSGTWGDTVNNSLTSLLDTAVAGTTTLSADADVTLTTTTLASNQARQAIILWTAGGTVTRNITAPAQSKAYVVINKTSSSQSIVLRGAGPTTGVTIIAGEKCLVVWNGVDFVKVTDAPMVIEGTTTSAALRITQLGSGNALLVEDSSNPDSTPVAIDASGTVLVGITTAQTIQGITPAYQQLGAGSYAGMWLGRYSANATANYIYLSKSRSATVGTNTVVQSGDDLGTLAFFGADGTNLIEAATILGEVDGTPGTNDMPGRLVFSTTADGASTATERMRIDSSGNVGIGTSSPILGLTIKNDTGSTTYGQRAGSLVLESNNVTGGGGTDVVWSSGTQTNQRYASIGSAIVGNDGASGSRGDIVFANKTTSAATTLTERMRIDSSGNVGIGTSSGTRKLNVYGGASGTRTMTVTSNASEGLEVGVNASNIAAINSAAGGAIIFTQADTERMRIDSSGTVTLASGSGLSIGRTAVTSPAATDGNVFSGTYTPTQVSTNTNVDSVTFSACQYMRVGSTVTVSGQLVIDATVAVTDTIVKMTVPIASNFAASRQLGGVGSSLTTPYASNNLVCIADTANDCVEVRLRPSVLTALTYNFSFTYLVV